MLSCHLCGPTGLFPLLLQFCCWSPVFDKILAPVFYPVLVVILSQRSYLYSYELNLSETFNILIQWNASFFLYAQCRAFCFVLFHFSNCISSLMEAPQEPLLCFGLNIISYETQRAMGALSALVGERNFSSHFQESGCSVGRRIVISSITSLNIFPAAKAQR